MTMPQWWNERRFGLLVQSSVAAVPAWAPIGEDADRYRTHVGDVVADVAPHDSPLVEVLDHHRSRWGHVATYDDFVELLTYERFDPEAWAQLVDDAGADYAVFSAMPADGWAWWDAPAAADRRLTEVGPRRDVLSEFAAACERHGIALGTSLSLLGWGADRGTVDALHARALDLVERYASAYLRADDGGAHDAGHWRSTEMLERARARRPDLVVNTGWQISRHTVDDADSDAADIVETFEIQPPADIVWHPWELVKPVGAGFGYNRAEREEHHLDAADIVTLYTEVVAKGGNLLLCVSPDAAGQIPEMQSVPLRAAGDWLRRYGPALGTTRPWTIWGDADVRYAALPDGVAVVDVVGAGSFSALDRSTVTVTGVVDLADGAPLTWRHDDDGLHVVPDSESPGPPLGIAAYRITCAPAESPATLFPPPALVRIPLAPLLADVRPGTIVQLGDASYEGPVDVPPGVTVRGLGADRSRITVPHRAAPSIVPDPPVVRLGPNARIEHLRVTGRADVADRFARPIVAITGASASVLGCTIDGSVQVDANDVLLRAITARGVVASGADRLHVSRSRFTGNAWDVGIEMRGGEGVRIDSSELLGHLCAVRLTDTSGSTVRGNTISARWVGVHVERANNAHVHGNRVSATMRAVVVDGGSGAVVDGNAVTDGDSGCIIEDGAADCDVYGNHWDRCRIGLLAWDAVGLRHQDNVSSSLHEPDSAFVSGP